ncbi:hypothetical protein DFH07DRAFT_1028486, partial [Mycena maculata]
MEKVLAAADCELGDLEDRSVDEFLGMLSKAQPGAKFNEGKLDIDFQIPLHCECRLLAKFHTRPLIPYVRVSKLTCAFCDMYFAAYRDATNSKIRTRGQTSKRLCLFLVNESALDSKIRKDIIVKLLQRIRNGWKLYRRSSLASQSTSTSGGEEQRSRYEEYGEMEEEISRMK